jgi:GAF domain-containing protein
VTTLQVLADQVALAISNTRLFSRVQQSLAEERRAFGELSQEAWQSLLRARSDLGYVSNEQGLVAAGDLWEPQMERALNSGQTTVREKGGDALSVPIRVRGQVIGVIDGRKPDGMPWTADEIALWEAMVEQLNVALEGARLYQDTQRRAAREQLIGQVAGRIRETLDLESMLRTAAGEMRRALDLDRLVVRLGTPGETERKW